MLPSDYDSIHSASPKAVFPELAGIPLRGEASPIIIEPRPVQDLLTPSAEIIYTPLINRRYDQPYQLLQVLFPDYNIDCPPKENQHGRTPYPVEQLLQRALESLHHEDALYVQVESNDPDRQQRTGVQLRIIALATDTISVLGELGRTPNAILAFDTIAQIVPLHMQFFVSDATESFRPSVLRIWPVHTDTLRLAGCELATREYVKPSYDNPQYLEIPVP